MPLGWVPRMSLLPVFSGILGQIAKIDQWHIDPHEKVKGLDVQYLQKGQDGCAVPGQMCFTIEIVKKKDICR